MKLGLEFFCCPVSDLEHHEKQGCFLGVLFSRALHGIDNGEVDVTIGLAMAQEEGQLEVERLFKVYLWKDDELNLLW